MGGFQMSFGEVVNLITVIGFGIGALLRYERRITRLETHLLHVLPKRATDAEHVS